MTLPGIDAAAPRSHRRTSPPSRRALLLASDYPDALRTFQLMGTAPPPLPPTVASCCVFLRAAHPPDFHPRAGGGADRTDVQAAAGGIERRSISGGTLEARAETGAVVIGDARPFLTALLMIDFDNVAKFAQDRAIPFTNYPSLCAHEDIQALIGSEVEAVNARFARVEQIKSFRLIDVQLTPQDEEFTPTLKLKRAVVNRRYRALIDDMYPGSRQPGATAQPGRES